MTLLPVAWLVLLLVGAWSCRPTTSRVDRRRRVLVGTRWREPAAAAAAMVAPLTLVPVVALAAWAIPVLRARRERERSADAIRRSLPEVVDLFHVAVASGLTVPLAVEAVSRRASGPLADELLLVLEETALGRRLGDALDAVPQRAGEVVRPLTAALVASARYGAPLGDALGRLAAEVRADRRRRAEEAARKVPVKLLFPLVCCVLPAFALLTLAPLLAGAIAALRL
ncbi:MAG TPA: type II secretion system F family protein [Acidimicrobiales bacterium]|nr:type II secretion system F family protein [Acidimicrobiales bacterium]